MYYLSSFLFCNFYAFRIRIIKNSTTKLLAVQKQIMMGICFNIIFHFFVAPIFLESVSSASEVFHHLEEFNINITVSWSDIGKSYLLWNPVLTNGTLATENFGVSQYVHEILTIGDFHYGQEAAVIYSISPEAYYPFFCNDSTYFNGKYTFLVQEGQSSSSEELRELFSFYVNITGKFNTD